jgi:hypothetical protein
MAVLAPVAAIDAGCGGQANQSQEPIRTAPDGGVSLEACPDRAPAVDSACSQELLSCQYGDLPDINSYCPDLGRTCIDGAWQPLLIACNPPRALSNHCPESLPDIGTSCVDYQRGLTCEYPFCSGMAPQVRCSDVSLTWEAIELPSCNPPAPVECPPEAPVLGSDCYFEGEQCVYGTCGDPQDPRSTPLCQDGFWVQLEVALCPTPEGDAGANAVDGGAADAGVADGG